jgi:hypothetical protein
MTRLGRLALPVVLAASCAIYGWVVVWPAARAQTNGYAAYYTAARVLTRRPGMMQRVYDDAWFAAQVGRVGIFGVYDIFNVQPPTMSLLLAPLAWCTPGAGRIAWIGVSFLLLPAGLLLLARSLDLPWQWAAWVLPICFLYAPVSENVRNGQAYLLLFFLLSAFFYASVRERPLISGAALGLMLILKSAGIWLWPLLVFQRRWRTLLWAVLAAVGVAVVTLPWTEIDAWAAYGSQLPRLATMPERYVTAYQTVTSLAGQLFVSHPRWNPSPAVHLPAVATALTAAVLFGSLAGSLLWTSGPEGVGVPAAGSHRRAGPGTNHRWVLMLALFSALLAPNAPVAEGYHYLLALPSLLVGLWHAWQSRARWQAWAVLLTAALLLGGPLPYAAPRLQKGWMALLAYPRVYGAYLLWAWLGWQLGAYRKRVTAVSAPVVTPREGEA